MSSYPGGPSAFDPIAFLSAQQTEVNEARALIPAGWYVSTIGEMDPIKAVKSGRYEKGENVGNPWLQVTVPHKIQLPSEVQALGLPQEFQLRDGVFIDLSPSGGIDNAKGKNNRQRMYREALGMNKPGEPFSWLATPGRSMKVEVKHKVLPDGRIVEEIGGVLPVS